MAFVKGRCSCRDQRAVSPWLIQTTDRALIREVLATLKAREGEILTLRFGLDDGEPKSLEGIGKRFCVTREHIRQIQDAGVVEAVRED